MRIVRFWNTINKGTPQLSQGKTSGFNPIFASILLILSQSGVAMAQEIIDLDETSPDSEVVEVETVEASPRVPETITIVGQGDQRSRVAGSAQAITQDELERLETNDIHQVLVRVPGVYVRGEDGYGLRPNIGMRGANSDRSAKVVLMEDGILLAPAPYSAPAAYFFPMTNRMVGVEVFKGPASIKSGPNTIGGAINLQSRGTPRAPTGFLDLSLGNYYTGKLHGYAGAGSPNWGVLLEGIRMQTEGFKELPSKANTGFQKNEFVLSGRYNTSPSARVYHQVNAQIGYSTELSHETYLGLTREDFDKNPWQRYAASQLGRMEWTHMQAKVSYQLSVDRFNLRATVYRRDFDRTWRHLNSFASGPSFNDILTHPQGREIELARLRGTEDILTSNNLRMGTNHRIFFSQGVDVVANLGFDTGVLGHMLNMGLRLHHDQVERKQTDDGYVMQGGVMQLDPSNQQDLSTDNRGASLAFAAYLQDELSWQSLLLTPGVRMEVIHREYENKLNGLEETGSDIVFIPGIGAYYEVLPGVGLLGGVHKGFSPVAPGQDKRNIKPESSINYELGTRAELPEFGLSGELIGFFNDYSNITGECTYSSGGCSTANLNDQYNGGTAFVYGLEALLQAGLPITDDIAWRAEFNYTLTLSQFRSHFKSGFNQWGTVEKGFELPYIPVHQGHLGVGVFGPKWSFDISVNGATAMRDQAGKGTPARDLRTDDYLVVDLQGHYDILEQLSAYVTVNNLLNTAYVASLRPYGVRPGLPFQLMVGLKFNIGERL